MSSSRLRLRRASSSLSLLKHDVYKISSGSPGINSVAATLTPDLQQSVLKPLFSAESTVCQIGEYLLTAELTSSSHSPTSSFKTFEAVNIATQQKFVCKVSLSLMSMELRCKSVILNVDDHCRVYLYVVWLLYYHFTIVAMKYCGSVYIVYRVLQKSSWIFIS